MVSESIAGLTPLLPVLPPVPRLAHHVRDCCATLYQSSPSDYTGITVDYVQSVARTLYIDSLMVANEGSPVSPVIKDKLLDLVCTMNMLWYPISNHPDDLKARTAVATLLPVLRMLADAYSVDINHHFPPEPQGPLLYHY